MSTPLEIKPEMVIPRVSGELAILADLHLDHYRQQGVDWFARHRLSEVPRSGAMPGVSDLCCWR